jgi:hypothetical protein
MSVVAPQVPQATLTAHENSARPYPEHPPAEEVKVGRPGGPSLPLQVACGGKVRSGLT